MTISQYYSNAENGDILYVHNARARACVCVKAF